jgi:hypothetical protein
VTGGVQHLARTVVLEIEAENLSACPACARMGVEEALQLAEKLVGDEEVRVREEHELAGRRPDPRVDRLRKAGPILELEQPHARVAARLDEPAHGRPLPVVVVEQEDLELDPDRGEKARKRPLEHGHVPVARHEGAHHDVILGAPSPTGIAGPRSIIVARCRAIRRR